MAVTQKQSVVIFINYKENYETTTTTIQWVLTSVQFNLVCFLSQTGSWEILVRVAIPTRTVCARGLATRTEHWFWFIFLCAWLSHAHVRVAKSRARILYTKSQPGPVSGVVVEGVHGVHCVHGAHGYSQAGQDLSGRLEAP